MGNKPKLSQRARYPLCTCEAYSFPHRPGGGLCRWPEAPLYRLTTPPSTKTGESWWECSGEVVRVEHDEPRQPEGPRTRPEIIGENWTREEEIADIMRRIGR